MRLLDIVAGARPNFMKIAPIIREIEARNGQGSTMALDFRLVHTGQHYDSSMSGDFFAQLGIPSPHVNLDVRSGTQAEQTAAIMVGYERLLLERRPDACLVVGDVNSTMACAISARKCGVPVAHVEAGIRSRDWSMPEEINRVVTDSITNWHFTTSESAGMNLRREGVGDDCIFFVGNTMIDTLYSNLERLRQPEFWARSKLERGGYLVLTLHRPVNVDTVDSIGALLGAIAKASRGLPIVFPVHPRTAKVMRELPALASNFVLVDPQPYLEFNYLVRNASAVITDSGGISEETTVLNVPCLTLRDNTERPETIEIGTNELVGTNPAAIGPALDRVFAGEWKKGAIPEKWDGQAAKRIVATLECLLSN